MVPPFDQGSQLKTLNPFSNLSAAYIYICLKTLLSIKVFHYLPSIQSWSNFRLKATSIYKLWAFNLNGAFSIKPKFKDPIASQPPAPRFLQASKS